MASKMAIQFYFFIKYHHGISMGDHIISKDILEHKKSLSNPFFSVCCCLYVNIVLRHYNSSLCCVGQIWSLKKVRHNDTVNSLRTGCHSHSLPASDRHFGGDWGNMSLIWIMWFQRTSPRRTIRISANKCFTLSLQCTCVCLAI